PAAPHLRSFPPRRSSDLPHVFTSYSTNGGNTWSAPVAQETSGDRGYYSAIAISPQGTDAYLVYNAFTTPFRNDTTSSRGLVGVVDRKSTRLNSSHDQISY